MRIIEIAPLENGAHNNHTYHGVLPKGWAFFPDELEAENFPFGNVIAEEQDGVPVVTVWEPLPLPEVEEEEAEPTTEEILNAMLGGNRYV